MTKTLQIILFSADTFQLINCQSLIPYRDCGNSGDGTTFNSSYGTIQYNPDSSESCKWIFNLPNNLKQFVLELEMKAIYRTPYSNFNYFIEVELPNGGLFCNGS